MWCDRVIQMEGISKRYRIGGPCAAREFWALRDVSIDVSEGETVGVIGRNGAGKSTLLKVLSRITPPTSGQIRARGRVSSLLEVGTGFHPELSGRENIYLNGAILGMSRREIARKFDEIVAFAGTEEFLDTPVKRYSSGMYVRLAFAVAAHLESDILVIDEVLAVGDTEFQRKCLGKMDDVARRGRTVLFVSHNMSAVDALCSRAVLLDGGRVVADGATADVIGGYLRGVRRAVSMPLAERADRSGKGRVRFTSIAVAETSPPGPTHLNAGRLHDRPATPLLDVRPAQFRCAAPPCHAARAIELRHTPALQQTCRAICQLYACPIRETFIRALDLPPAPLLGGDGGADIVVRATVISSYPHPIKARLALSIRTANEVGLISCDSALTGETYTIAPDSETRLTCRVFSPPLNEGDYLVNIALYNGAEAEDWVTSAAGFSVQPKLFDNRVASNAFPILARFSWSVEKHTQVILSAAKNLRPDSSPRSE